MIQTMEWTSKYRLVNTLNIYTLNFEHLENEPEPYFYMFIQLLKVPATFPTIMVTTYTTCWMLLTRHSSEKRGLRSTFLSGEMLQNLPYL